MDEKQSRKHWKKTPEEKKAACRRMAEDGATFQDIAKLHDVSVETLRTWGRRYKWLTPHRLAKAAKLAREEVIREVSTPPSPEQTQQSCDKPQLPAVSHPQLAQLLTLAQNGPPEFVKSATQYLQTLLAENANVIEINNLRDWKEVWGMWRQGAGLDKHAAGGNGNAPLVNPIRTVSRRSGPVIDAESILESTPLDEWEP